MLALAGQTAGPNGLTALVVKYAKIKFEIIMFKNLIFFFKNRFKTFHG